jgi:penicillin-binding protein 2
MGGLDSDITAPLLVETLRQRYKIPDTWTEIEARKVIGLLYEMSLRKYIPSLSMYVFLPDASEEEISAIVELNIPGMKVEVTTVRQYSTVYAAHILGYVGAMSESQWEQYKNIDGYEMDAEIGQDGLEAAYEQYLRIRVLAAKGFSHGKGGEDMAAGAASREYDAKRHVHSLAVRE